MASFQIADCPTALALAKGSQGEHKGALSLNVRNATDRALTGRVRVEPQGGAQAGWFRLEGASPTSPVEMDLDFDARASQTVKVALAVPPGTPGGDHLFRVRVTSERDPDNDYTQSPTVAFKVPPPEVAPPVVAQRKIPWWAVAAAAAVLVVVIGVATFLFSGPKMVAVPPVNNQRFVEAVVSLANSGFVTGQSRVERNPGLADQIVIGSEPKQGENAPAGSTVVLVVNDNPPGGGGNVALCKRNPILCARIDNLQTLQSFTRDNPAMLQQVSPNTLRQLQAPQ